MGMPSRGSWSEHFCRHDSAAPSVIVDGSAHPDTLLTLSHWPNSPTPAVLRDDLSAQIAFHYLDHPELHVPAEVVSNNHFDQDGLASVYTLVDPEAAQVLANAVSQPHIHGNELTERERDVLKGMVDGLNNNEIADKLVISLGTVKFHISNIFQKLGIDSRVEAVKMAIQQKLV